jgi:hypothetical protein
MEVVVCKTHTGHAAKELPRKGLDMIARKWGEIIFLEKVVHTHAE